ncbi:MAG: GNAT family N-acetyltransferase [Symploca sp. SIO2E6]|nr:GNAT family N-acetyltransferase [Symploca sp. SIO2E6]
MTYTHRLATTSDTTAVATLWQAFAQDRAKVDPSMVVKPDFNYTKYMARQLANPLTYAWVLLHESDAQTTIVGCMIIYFYDEAPPLYLPQEMLEEHLVDNPFVSRRVGSVLGLYIKPEHRQPEAIKLLTNAAIAKAEEMKVNDIDLLISADQTGMQAFVQKSGFTKAAVQYTKHYQVPDNDSLPSLHPPHPDIEQPKLPVPGAIPLRDPQTNELVRNPQGEVVFLMPLTIEATEERKLPIYPTPVRDPQTQTWVFDVDGQLVVAPVVRDEEGQIMEYKGIPQFYPPAYQHINGKLTLKQDGEGNYVFCEVEKDPQGKIIRTPDGRPVFKQFRI